MDLNWKQAEPEPGTPDERLTRWVERRGFEPGVGARIVAAANEIEGVECAIADAVVAAFMSREAGEDLTALVGMVRVLAALVEGL